MDMILFLLFICIFVVDVYDKIIPDILIILVVMILFYCTDDVYHSIRTVILTFLILNAIYFLLKIIYGKVMFGYGDVKLLSGISINLHINITEIVFFAFFTSLIYIVLLFLIKKRISLEEEIPFAPFILISYYIVLWK